MAYSELVKPIQVVRGRRYRWWTAIVYLLPIVFTTVLLYINFAQLFWFPVGGIGSGGNGPAFSANNVLNSLQLAAKLYEVSVVASLGAIVLEAFKQHLIADGVPFGLLTGAYRMFDVMYLSSPRFWTAAPKAVWLAALLVLSIVLCTLVGPASAILMVPKLGWFPLPNAFSNVRMPLLVSPPGTVWPTVLNATPWEVWPDCRTTFGTYVDYCPAAGFSSIRTWALGYTFSEALPNNITFQDSSTVSRRLDMRPGGSRGTLLATPTSITVKTVDLLRGYIESYDVGDISQTENYNLRLKTSSVNYQPLVNAKCNVWNLQEYGDVSKIPEMHYPYEELICFSDDDGDDCHRIRDQISNWTVPRNIWENQDGLFRFWTIQGEDLSSLVFYARLPYYNKGERGIRAAACSYMAHWVPSVVSAGPRTDTLVESNVTDLSIFEDDGKHGEVAVGPLIQIDDSWLPYWDLGLEVNDTQSNGTRLGLSTTSGTNFHSMVYLFDALIEQAPNGSETWDYFGPGSIFDTGSRRAGDRQVQTSLEMFTGAIITDAIARSASFYTPVLLRHGSADGSIALVTLANLDDPPDEVFANGTAKNSSGSYDLGVTPDERIAQWKKSVVSLDFEAERYGYGYGKSGGAMTFALVVILTCIATLLLSLVVMVYRGAHMVIAVDDLQDLVALAWKSPTPVGLESQGVNVRDNTLWQDNVSMKATSVRSVTMALNRDTQGTNLSHLKRGEEYW